MLSRLYQASGSAASPAAYTVLCVRFSSFVRSVNLLQNCNTRYGWRVKPYPMGTSTPQEVPGFAWRTTAQRITGEKLSERSEHSFSSVFIRIVVRPAYLSDASRQQSEGRRLGHFNSRYSSAGRNHL